MSRKWTSSANSWTIRNICPIPLLWNASASFTASRSAFNGHRCLNPTTCPIWLNSSKKSRLFHSFLILFFRNIKFQCIKCSQFLLVRFDSFLQLCCHVRTSLSVVIWILSPRQVNRLIFICRLINHISSWLLPILHPLAFLFIAWWAPFGWTWRLVVFLSGQIIIFVHTIVTRQDQI